MRHLLRARNGRGLTQKQLAERCGLHPSVLSRIESGQREASLHEVVRLAEALHVPLEWFVTGEEWPGTTLSDIAAELWHLGIVDLIVPRARVPGAYRPAEEVLALARGNRISTSSVCPTPSCPEANDLAASKLERYAAKARDDLRHRCDNGLVRAEQLRQSLTNAIIWHEEDNPDRERAFANLEKVMAYLEGQASTV